MKKWTLASSTQVGDYPVFAIERHEVRDGEGKPRRDVYTFRCNDWCNVIAITEANELVMVWQYRFGSDALSLEIPGGVVDSGEDPLEAARRELLEETGYEAGELVPLVVVEPNPALQNNRCFTYVARGARRSREPQFDDLEELELTLVPVESLPALLDGGHVTHALVQSALETFLRKHTRA